MSDEKLWENESPTSSHRKKREIGGAKERIEAFKKRLQETMACWPKDVWNRLSNTENKVFLLSMQNDRTASIAGKDIKTDNWK